MSQDCLQLIITYIYDEQQVNSAPDFLICICAFTNLIPPAHNRVMWFPGATAGSLWSLGNVGSIVAVEHLGQGVSSCRHPFSAIMLWHDSLTLPFLPYVSVFQVGYSASQAALLIRFVQECYVSFLFHM